MKSTLPILFFLLGLSAFAQVPNQRSPYAVGDPDAMLTIEEAPSGPNNNAGYYQQDGKYGFVYPEHTRQKAIYDKIEFAGVNFIIKKGKLYGFTDRKGELIGKMEYDSIGHSYQGDVFIVKKNDKYGTISNEGKTILSIKYNKVLYSSAKNPVSFIRNNDGNLALVYNKQEKMFPEKIDYAEVYENLSIVKVKGKYGAIKENVIIPFEYDSIYVPITEGYDMHNRSKKAKKTNPLVLDYSKLSKNVSVMTGQKGTKLGLLDNMGNIIFPVENDMINNVDIKRYCTVKKNNLYGIYFMDTNIKTPVEFDRVYADGTGYVMADKNKKGGVFNIKGEQIIPFEYDPEFIAQYRFGLQIVKDKKKGLTDKKGKLIIPPIYDDIDSFYEWDTEQYLKVKIGQKLGVINLKNEVIIPIEFEWIGEENGFFKVVTPEPERNFGLYNTNGKVIGPAKYRSISGSHTENSKLTILRKEDDSYNFISKEGELLFVENLKKYGYVMDQDKLLNPLSFGGRSLMLVQNKNDKYGLLNEVTGVLDIPMVYDEICQKFQTDSHIYFSVRKGKKYGLINENNKEIIPFNYDLIDINQVERNYDDENDARYQIVVKKANKFGTVNLKNEIKIPLQYAYLHRISKNGLYKAKVGNYYQIINSKNEVVNKGPFDEVANFELISTGYNTRSHQTLTFSNGKMKVIADNGKFISTEVEMTPHRGYETFEELKQSLIKSLDNKSDDALKEFASKIAPSKHLLYYLKENQFDKKSLQNIDIDYIQDKYYRDLLDFKNREWNVKGGFAYNRNSLTDVADYTLERENYVTNERVRDHAFGDTRFLEKLLRNSIKVNGYWISTYFMTRRFDMD